VIVRPETDDDRDSIRRVVDDAFGDTETSRIVDGIWSSDRFVPELSLVAESEEELVGHVISSYVDLVPGTRRVLQVGPLAVVPSHQRQGVGTALMQETVRVADERGEPLLLIEGNPKYYERFGFARADQYGIEMPPESHGAQFFMLRKLATYDPGITGRAVYPAETFLLGY
jgi:putative acetyltransferase